MKKTARLILISIPVILGWIYTSCTRHDDPKEPELDVSLFWSMGDTLSYVGIEACKTCHYDIYTTYITTGMGSSFGEADTQKSAIPRDAGSIYDSFSRYYYSPFFVGDRLWLREYRLMGADTIYNKSTDIRYIIGSGHHTNSHIIHCNGYLFQAPFTYYTQSGRLDLPPGFENGNNSRYARPIGLECMSCHNAMPTGFVTGSENKFESLPLGIDCERCHGPGSGHVAKILRGDITDTSYTADFSIVNPKRLPVRLRFELCQRCHLQGNVVLAEGKSFFDFRPGMLLRDVLDVYLPKYEDDEHFIMASHADRLSQSMCFTASKNKMDCTTCHNPHVSSRKLGDAFFNEKCQSCHKVGECREKSSVRKPVHDNCVSCHMPVSGSIDIPHVTIHDHKIGVHKKLTDKQKKEKIIALVAINNPTPTLKSKVNAYLQQFERFEPLGWYLDSAYAILKNLDRSNYLREWVHYAYLRDDMNLFRSLYPTVVKNAEQTNLNTPSATNENAWYWHRVAHLTANVYGVEASLPFHSKALKLAPHHFEFKAKYAIALAKIGQIDEALSLLLEVHSDIPHLYEVSGNIGYIYMVKKEYFNAEKYLLHSLKENPDYKMAYKNLIQLYAITNSKEKLEALQKQILQNSPELYRELYATFR